MAQAILIVILFLMGIYFGSFFTLATYRLPKKENIMYQHSYCPNCNHKLGVLDLVPIFSYLFLRGKCRYCKNSIGIRYFLFELLTGIVFVLFALSLHIDLYNLTLETIIYFVIGILYFTGLFMIAGINKEKGTIQSSVLYYNVIISIIYIIYSYTLDQSNVYKYAIYLSILLILILWNTDLFRKNFKYNSVIQTLILIMNMLIFTGEYITIATLLLVIFTIGIENIIQYIRLRKSPKVITKSTKKPIVFYICVSNVIMLIGSNFLINYMIR